MVGGALMQKIDNIGIACLPIFTKEELLKELEISRIQIENGEGQDMVTALDEIRKEIGL